MSRRKSPVSAAPSAWRSATPRAGATYISAKAVGSMVPGLTRKAFERFGFSTATLLTDWEQIVGADLARYTAPDRLKWPCNGTAGGSHDEPAEGPSRQGATLVLRVDLGRGIDIQYKARQLIERINAHFGYRAVAEIRIIQAPVDGALPPAEVASPARVLRKAFNRGETAPLLAAIPDDGLRAALERMQAGLSRV